MISRRHRKKKSFINFGKGIALLDKSGLEKQKKKILEAIRSVGHCHSNAESEGISTTLKAGFLMKKNANFVGWEKRYFVIGSNSLTWYKNPGENFPLGFVSVADILSVNLLPKKAGRRFDIITDDRVLKLMDTTPEGALQWSKMIGELISHVRRGGDRKRASKDRTQAPTWLKTFWHQEGKQNQPNHLGESTVTDEENVFGSELYKLGLGNQGLLKKLLTHFTNNETILRLFIHLLISPPRAESQAGDPQVNVSKWGSVTPRLDPSGRRRVNLRNPSRRNSENPSSIRSDADIKKALRQGGYGPTSSHNQIDATEYSSVNLPVSGSTLHGTEGGKPMDLSTSRRTIGEVGGGGGGAIGPSSRRLASPATTAVSSRVPPSRMRRGSVSPSRRKGSRSPRRPPPPPPPKMKHLAVNPQKTERRQHNKKHKRSATSVSSPNLKKFPPPPPPKSIERSKVRMAILNSQMSRKRGSLKPTGAPSSAKLMDSFSNLGNFKATEQPDAKATAETPKGRHRKIISWAQGDHTTALSFKNTRITKDMTSMLDIDEQLMVFRYLIDTRSEVVETLIEAIQNHVMGEKGESLGLRVLWLLLVTKQRLACAVNPETLGVKFARYIATITSSVSIDKILQIHKALLGILTTPIEKLNSDIGRTFRQSDRHVQNPSVWLAVFANLNGSHIYPRLQGVKDILYILVKNTVNCETLMGCSKWQTSLLPLLFDIPSIRSSLASRCQAYLITIINTLHWQALSNRNLSGFASVIRSTILAVMAPCHSTSIKLMHQILLSIITTAQYHIAEFSSELTPHLNCLWNNTAHLVKLAECLVLQTPSKKLFIPDPTAKEYMFRREMRGLDDEHLINSKRLCIHALQVREDSDLHGGEGGADSAGFVLDQRALESALRQRREKILEDGPGEGGTGSPRSSRIRSKSAPATPRTVAPMTLRSVGSVWLKNIHVEVALLKKALLFLQQLRLSAMDHLGVEKNALSKKIKSSVELLLKEIPLLGETTAFMSLLQEKHRLLEERDVWSLMQNFATTKDSKCRRRVFRQYEKIIDKKEIEKKMHNLEIEILLVGHLGSGKSTVRKQLMRHCKRNLDEHRVKCRELIYKGVIVAMRRMIYHCNRLRQKSHGMSESGLIGQIKGMLKTSNRKESLQLLERHLSSKAECGDMFHRYRQLLIEAQNDLDKVPAIVAIAEELKAKQKSLINPKQLEDWKNEFFKQFDLGDKCQEAIEESLQFSAKLGKAIAQLWAQESIKKAYALRYHFGTYSVGDSAAYFFERTETIAEESTKGSIADSKRSSDSSGKHNPKSDGYLPSDEDIIRWPEQNAKGALRVVSFGFEINQKKLEIKLVDLSGENDTIENRGWVKYLSKHTRIFFVVDLSTYDQVVIHSHAPNVHPTVDDKHTNNALCMQLQNFEKVCRDPVLHGIPISVLFNKDDLFKEKIRVVPLSVCFPDVEEKSANSYDHCLKYIQDKFMRKCASIASHPRKVAVHIVSAVENKKMEPIFAEFDQHAIDSSKHA
eukprot:jgi/Bigna1/79189/fgenesh1_pg.60_\